jgi:hypothetical protein
MQTVLGVLTFLSALEGALTFIPRLSVAPVASIRVHDPMGTVFSLTNNGILPIHDVQALCGIDRVKTTGGGGISGIAFEMPESHADVLLPTDSMTVPCAHAVNMGAGAASAEITIHITYRPDLVPWHREIDFPLEAEKADDGTWLWKHKPK